MSSVIRKTAFCICESKDADQFRSNRAFNFATVQSLYLIHLKFQASSHLLWLYSRVCVRPGRKAPKTGFSRDAAQISPVVFKGYNCIKIMNFNLQRFTSYNVRKYP